MKNKIDSLLTAMRNQALAGICRSPDLIEGIVDEAVRNHLAPGLSRAQREWDKLINPLRKKNFELADDLEAAMLLLVDEQSRLVWRLALGAGARKDGDYFQVSGAEDFITKEAS